MDAPYILSMASGGAWTPLSLPSLFCHYDLSSMEVVYDGGQSRDEVNTWYDQGPTGTNAIPITYPDDGLKDAILRPPYVLDAGDGYPAIDGSDNAIGRGLSAPFSVDDLRFLHQADQPWTLSTNLYLSGVEGRPCIMVSSGAATAANAGISLWAAKITPGYNLRLDYADGTDVEYCLDTVISGPENCHLWIVCDPSASRPVRLWRNGVDVDYWAGTLPSAQLAVGNGKGLCFGNFARSSAYAGSCWKGRFVTIYSEAITDENTIKKHAEWARKANYV